MWSTGISRVVFESHRTPNESIRSSEGRVRAVNVRESGLHRTVRDGSCIHARSEDYSVGRREPMDAATTAVEAYHSTTTITTRATPGGHSLAR